nr:helix-turn-helix transcriptional regulator [uncultured Rhodopila sp.]
MPFQEFRSRRDDQTGGSGHGSGQRCGSGPRGGRGRGQGGAGRNHDAAGMRLATLAVLADQPGNGLAVMRALAAQGYCQAVAGASSVYPSLSLLTDMGMISAGTEPSGRTVYTMLDAGAAVLAANRPLIEAIMAESNSADGRSAAPVRRAGRLKRRCRGQQAAPAA